MNRNRVRDLTLCAMFAAVLCVFSVMTIPIGPVPVSMAIFGVMLAGLLLGWKRGFISTAIYVLLGAIGIPVFSGFRGGFSMIIGPTGGYITSYLVVVVIIGLITAKRAQHKLLEFAQGFLACIIGLAICYLMGTIQFVLVTGNTFLASLSICVFPFIPFDIIKALVAISLAYTMRRVIPQLKESPAQ